MTAEIESFLTGWERVIKSLEVTTPLDGDVIEPEQPWINQAASIICGHPFIYVRLVQAEQAEFEMFVREVLRTSSQR